MKVPPASIMNPTIRNGIGSVELSSTNDHEAIPKGVEGNSILNSSVEVGKAISHKPQNSSIQNREMIELEESNIDSSSIKENENRKRLHEENVEVNEIDASKRRKVGNIEQAQDQQKDSCAIAHVSAKDSKNIVISSVQQNDKKRGSDSELAIDSSTPDKDVVLIEAKSILLKYSCILDPIPILDKLPKISKNDEYFLDAVLQLESGEASNKQSDNRWQSDWVSNLNFLNREIILNKDKIKENPSTRIKKLTFLELVVEDAYNKNDFTTNGFRGIFLLFSRIYHMKVIVFT